MAYEWQSWFVRAERDLAAARVLATKEFYDGAAFHAHQAAEHCLKGRLLQEDRLPPHTSNIVRLARELGAPTAVVDDCCRLNPHFIVSRYPDAALGNPADNYSEAIARELLDAGERVFQWCSSQPQ